MENFTDICTEKLTRARVYSALSPPLEEPGDKTTMYSM